MTHVFYSPHTDDEVIGMAGAILAAVDNGDRAVLVLVTDNLPSAHCKDVFVDYEGDLSVARVAEFDEAAHRMGVADVRRLHLTEDRIFNHRRDSIKHLARVMAELHAQCGGDAAHHTTMGDNDPHVQTGRSNRAHGVCEEAGRLFQRETGARVLLHKVYVYSQPDAFRAAQCVTVLDGATMTRKRHALDAYKANGARIGYGYRSVPELFDGAASDAREFFEVIV